MLLAILFNFCLLLFLLLGLDLFKFFVILIDDIDISSVLHIFWSFLPLFFLLFPQSSLCLHFKKFSFFHLIFVLIHILLYNLFMLLFLVFQGFTDVFAKFCEEQGLLDLVNLINSIQEQELESMTREKERLPRRQILNSRKVVD